MITKMKEVRFFRGITLDEIYVLTGRKIDQPKLSRIERGVTIPKEEEKKLIARVLKVPVADIFREEEKK